MDSFLANKKIMHCHLILSATLIYKTNAVNHSVYVKWMLSTVARYNIVVNLSNTKSVIVQYAAIILRIMRAVEHNENAGQNNRHV